MKKLFFVLIASLLLAGCAESVPVTQTVQPATPAPIQLDRPVPGARVAVEPPAPTPTVPILLISKTALSFSSMWFDGMKTDTITLSNTGAGNLDWQATTPVTWLELPKSSGRLVGSAIDTLTINCKLTDTGSTGTYKTEISIFTPGAEKPSTIIPVEVVMTKRPPPVIGSLRINFVPTAGAVAFDITYLDNTGKAIVAPTRGSPTLIRSISISGVTSKGEAKSIFSDSTSFGTGYGQMKNPEQWRPIPYETIRLSNDRVYEKLIPSSLIMTIKITYYETGNIAATATVPITLP